MTSMLKIRLSPNFEMHFVPRMKDQDLRFEDDKRTDDNYLKICIFRSDTKLIIRNAFWMSFSKQETITEMEISELRTTTLEAFLWTCWCPVRNTDFISLHTINMRIIIIHSYLKLGGAVVTLVPLTAKTWVRVLGWHVLS